MDVVGNVSKKRLDCYYWEIPEFFLHLEDTIVRTFRSPRFSFLDFSVTFGLALHAPYPGLMRLTLDVPDSSIDGKRVTCTMCAENSAGILKTSVKKFTYKTNGIYSQLHPSHIDLSSFQKLIRSEMLQPSALTIVFSTAADGGPRMVSHSSQTDATSEVELLTQPSDTVGTVGLARDLKGLLLSGDESDAAVRVKLQEFKVHRSILAARTPVFSAMFRNDTSERASGIVDIEDSDPDTIRRFLQFIYTGGIDDLTADNARGVYEMADKYQLLELKEKCLECIKRGLSVKTFCHVITLALKHHEKDLTALATDFFGHNVRKIIRTVEWQVFMNENPTQANELLIKGLGDEEN